jgi:hypothetical protein
MGCDNCHLVAVIRRCSSDIGDALERLGAVPLELTVPNTTLWSWSEGTFPRAARSRQPTPPQAMGHGRGQTPSIRGELPLSPGNRARRIDGRVPEGIPPDAHRRTGGWLDG